MAQSTRTVHSPPRAQCNCAAAIIIRQRGDLCVIRCRGCLLAGLESDYVQAKIGEIKQRNCNKVLADFRAVPVIGSTGIAFIVGIYTSVVQDSGGRFVVAGATPLVRRALNVTRLSAVIPLVDDLRSALAILSGRPAAADMTREVC